MVSQPALGMRCHYAIHMMWNPREGEGSSTTIGAMAGLRPGDAAEQGATGPATAGQAGEGNNTHAAPNPTNPGTSLTHLEFSRAVLQRGPASGRGAL
ncbi:hypothetical protein AAFF_G00294480 [Aldrovandia affinis]|uniref:Uncharacterized protein n=1 Tax=Aldrovandia affinis TaxID=143900 RepID=A0AAD7R995_9TELE|nr:hypothetical protein AAFF_G00294480 [Aldrovandia affinis]